MPHFVRYSIALGLILGTAQGAMPLRADELDQRSCLTFSGRFELPGVTLPAGSYIFKLADPAMGDRHIVQVFSSDMKTVYGTFLTIPNERLKATDKTVVTFSESQAGAPEPVKAWFYPDERSGEEFVYPKDQASSIAKRTQAPVLYTASSAAAMHKARISRVNEKGKDEDVKTPRSAKAMSMNSLKESMRIPKAVPPCQQ